MENTQTLRREHVVMELGRYIGNNRRLLDMVLAFRTEVLILLLGYYEQEKAYKYGR